MSWTRLDDAWSEKLEQRVERVDDRWHMLTMIQFACRAERYDGTLRLVDARRCSDHEDPDGAISRLSAAGLLEVDDKSVTIIGIDAHVPPPSVRQKAENDRIRKRRQRAHAAGNHLLCLPEHCSVTQMSRVTKDVTPGRDGTGQLLEQPSTEREKQPDEGVTQWPTVPIPN